MARRVKLEVWSRQKVRGAIQTLAFLQKPRQFLTTTLVGNNIAIVTASSLLAFYWEPHVKGIWITIITSFILLFWAEMVPKEIARVRATSFSVLACFGLRFFHILLYPMIWFVMTLSQGFIRLLGMQKEKKEEGITRKDLDLLFREGHQTGLVDDDQRDLISRFILRGILKVRDIMVPRTDITFVRQNDSVDQVALLFEQTGFSRIPVVDGDIDKILGMVTAKDILLMRPKELSAILRNVLFAPELQRIGDLLQMMKKERVNMAFVVDEYGGTAGLVTLEDIVEEFFGEIEDEFDEAQQLHRNGVSGQLEVKAKMSIEDLNKGFHLHLTGGDYQTLGGFLMDRLGHVPKRKEKLETDDYLFTVLSATRKKVHWVRIEKRNQD